MNDDSPISDGVNIVFSLRKLAFSACSEAEKKWCLKSCPGLTVDLQQCCIELIDFIKIGKHGYIKNTEDHIEKIAARFGHLECLIIAHENGLSNPDSDVCLLAARYGHLKCLKYACENGYSLDTRVCLEAAKNGHLESLKYAHQKGAVIDRWTCFEAAMEGHVDCMKYAHKNGCPLDDIFITMEAATTGNMEMLKYAHENGCPWDVRVFNEAYLNGDVVMMKYMREHGCPEEEVKNEGDSVRQVFGRSYCVSQIKVKDQQPIQRQDSQVQTSSQTRNKKSSQK